MGCEIVTVSADTQFVHLAWQREEKDLEAVKFHMGSDRNGDLAKQFGVWNGGFCLRGTYLISPAGMLMNAEVNFLNLGRNIDETMRKFKVIRGQEALWEVLLVGSAKKVISGKGS